MNQKSQTLDGIKLFPKINKEIHIYKDEPLSTKLCKWEISPSPSNFSTFIVKNFL